MGALRRRRARGENGLNFTERGFGVRAALGVSDRGHTAVSQLAPGDVDWERIFGGDGARWFHCGGIFCALSDSTAELALEAMAAARRHGTIVSYDLNYRPSLWKALGGPARAAEVNRRAVELVDVLVGNEEDFGAALGYEVEGVDASLLELDAHTYEPMLARVMADYDQLALTAVTLRQAARRRSTTGRPCAAPAGASTSDRASTASRSSTVSVAGTRSPPASSSAC